MIFFAVQKAASANRVPSEHDLGFEWPYHDCKLWDLGQVDHGGTEEQSVRGSTLDDEPELGAILGHQGAHQRQHEFWQDEKYPKTFLPQKRSMHLVQNVLHLLLFEKVPKPGMFFIWFFLVPECFASGPFRKSSEKSPESCFWIILRKKTQGQKPF